MSNNSDFRFAAEPRALWRICLFGNLRVVDIAGVLPDIVHFRTHRSAALLAYLACFRRLHSREELAELLWPDSNPVAARSRLRQEIATLRRQLEPPGVILQGSVIDTSGREMVGIRVGAIRTDLEEFDEILRLGVTATREPREAALTEAAALHGSSGLLPGWYEMWVTQERERTAAVYASCLNELARLAAPAAIHHAPGFTNPAVTNLAFRAVYADPANPNSHETLVRHLDASGNEEIARRRLKAWVRLGVEEGLEEPPLDLQRLVEGANEEGARGKSADLVESPQALPAIAALERVPPPRNFDVAAPMMPWSAVLPRPLNRFFGRERELNDLRGLILGETPPSIVTLSGPGGSGKTRLALECAHLLRQTASPRELMVAGFVPLAAVTDASQLTSHAASAVFPRLEQTADLTIDRLAEMLETDTLIAGSKSAKGPRIVIILDNFEQIAEAGAAWIGELVRKAPSLIVIVTSRQPLRIDGEQEYPVAPLPLAETEEGEPTLAEVTQAPSAALFADRAALARPDFRITARNAADVAAVCRKLDGIPLALEIAAARIAQFGPSRMRAELENDLFGVLVSRRRDAEERHRTLRATIAWSVGLLAPDVCRFFSRLAFFQDGWRAEAAAAVAGNDVPEQTFSRLQILVDHSLIISEADPATGEPRFRMLETLRAFAVEQCPEAEHEEIRARHVQFFLNLAEDISLKLERDRNKRRWFDIMASDNANFEYAVESALALSPDRNTALRMFIALYRFWMARHQLPFLLNWLDRAFPNGPESIEADDAFKRLAYAKIAIIYQDRGAVELCVRYTNESERLCRLAADAWNLAETLAMGLPGLTLDQWHERNLETLSLAEKSGNQVIEARMLIYLGTSAHARGRPEEEQQRLGRALRLANEANIDEIASFVYNEIAYIALHRSELAYASRLLERSTEICRDLGHAYLGHTLWLLGMTYGLQGRYAEAEKIELEGLAIRRRVSGNDTGLGIALAALGILMYETLRFDEARRYFDEYRAVHLRQPMSSEIPHPSAGWLSLYQGDLLRAELEFELVENHLGAFPNDHSLAPIYEGQARIAILRRDWTRARERLAKALTIRRSYENRRAQAFVLELYALLLAAEGGDDGQAVTLFAAAAAERERIGAPMPPVERIAHDAETQTLRQRMGDAAFDAAFKAGGLMTLEDAVERALGPPFP